METTHDQVLQVLSLFLAPLNARSVLNRALVRCQLTTSGLNEKTMVPLLVELNHGIRLFLRPEQQTEVRAMLATLAEPPSIPERNLLRIETESDVTRARSITRKMCEGAGAGALALQKCATAVSELARNIIAYTPGGEVELSVRDGTPRLLRVVASDRGQGISDLQLVLSGKYKSRTGLGRGLIGVKRLAEDFSVQTSSTGTRVEALLSLGIGFGPVTRSPNAGGRAL